MIWFDVTKVSTQSHRSGLVRVSERLRAELGAVLGDGLGGVVWHGRRRTWIDVRTRRPVAWSPQDRLLTPELFSEAERPGLGTWLAAHGARAAAIFHDAIPLQFPAISWPQSVARHPDYMRLLAGFGRVFAISQASARDLRAHWAATDLRKIPPVTPIVLGADAHQGIRIVDAPDRSRSRSVVMVGIVEPRKNQEAVLDALEALAGEGLAARVTFIGRVNPHFGRPIARRIREVARRGGLVEHREAADDAEVARLIAQARFGLMPSRAEGCGLPVLEALWAGLPVLASALPSIEESARGGGCLLVPPGDTGALTAAMRRLLTDDRLLRSLQHEASTRELPRWRDTAALILRAWETDAPATTSV